MIVIENKTDGTLTGKGSFTLTEKERKYIIAFTYNILIKDGKYKYDFTDLLIRYTTKGGVSSGGYGYWSSTTYKESETLEHTLETFYPIRLTKRRKPSIKWYELTNTKSFETIDREMTMIVNALKDNMSMVNKW